MRRKSSVTIVIMERIRSGAVGCPSFGGQWPSGRRKAVAPYLDTNSCLCMLSYHFRYHSDPFLYQFQVLSFFIAASLHICLVAGESWVIVFSGNVVASAPARGPVVCSTHGSVPGRLGFSAPGFGRITSCGCIWPPGRLMLSGIGSPPLGVAWVFHWGGWAGDIDGPAV